MRIIALFGPTGVGKTAVAIALAERLRARGEDPVAVSADALQLYAGLEVLTGAADALERSRLEHRLVAVAPVSESFSAGRYAELAHAEIDGLLAAGRRPLLVGGTGLYLRAALAQLDLRPPVPAALRAGLQEALQRDGAPALHERLAALDSEAAAVVDPRDSQRVLRALELAAAGVAGSAGQRDQLWSEHMRRPTLLVGLTMGREALYEAIDRRVEAMVAAGAREEVLRAERQGASPGVRKALGYRELLDGDVEAMKRRTRNYAKRQLTWMRKLAAVMLIDVEGRDPAATAAQILDSGAA